MSPIAIDCLTENRNRRRVCASLTRGGSTLLEIVLATGILLVALTAIGNQGAMGIQAGIRVRMESEAMWHCQTLMQETNATVGRKNVNRPTPIPFHDDWLYTIEIQEGPSWGLEQIRVTVWKPGNLESATRFQLVEIVHKSTVGNANFGPRAFP